MGKERIIIMKRNARKCSTTITNVLLPYFHFLRPAIVCLRVKVQDVDYEIEIRVSRLVRGEVPGSTRSRSSYQLSQGLLTKIDTFV